VGREIYQGYAHAGFAAPGFAAGSEIGQLALEFLIYVPSIFVTHCFIPDKQGWQR
jgi:hypothetical protein